MVSQLFFECLVLLSKVNDLLSLGKNFRFQFLCRIINQPFLLQILNFQAFDSQFFFCGIKFFERDFEFIFSDFELFSQIGHLFIQYLDLLF